MCKPHRVFTGWGDTVIGWACEALAVATYVFWVLPRAAYLHWTGQLPPPRDPQAWRSHDKEGKW